MRTANIKILYQYINNSKIALTKTKAVLLIQSYIPINLTEKLDRHLNILKYM